MNDVIRMVLVCVSGVLPKRFFILSVSVCTAHEEVRILPTSNIRATNLQLFFYSNDYHVSMNPCMTRFAKGFQVVYVVCSTLGQRLDVMYLLGWRVYTFLKADFTKQMGSSVAIFNTFPSSAIPSLGSSVAFVSFIALGINLCMFFTEATVSKVGTAGRDKNMISLVVLANETPPCRHKKSSVDRV